MCSLGFVHVAATSDPVKSRTTHIAKTSGMRPLPLTGQRLMGTCFSKTGFSEVLITSVCASMVWQQCFTSMCGLFDAAGQHLYKLDLNGMKVTCHRLVTPPQCHVLWCYMYHPCACMLFNDFIFDLGVLPWKAVHPHHGDCKCKADATHI